MTFLPIVERELRAASRRPATYRTRAGLAFLAGLMVAGTILLTSELLASTLAGRYVFYGLSGLLMVYCLGYGRYATADCLSVEKREGTLGLLFLTDLTGWDIVLGKLAGTSINGLYALLAVLPVLSVGLLLGGVSLGEYGRMVLVLLSAFLLSLSAGMLGSACTRQFRYAMAANFFLWLFFIILLPLALLGASLNYFRTPGLFNPSPVYGYVLAFDGVYSLYKSGYWTSFAAMQATAWLLLLLSGLLLPRARLEARATSPSRWAQWREWWEALSFGPRAGRAAFRRRLLEVNAFYWLAARARLKPLHVWIVLLALAVYWLAGRFIEGPLWLSEEIFLVVAAMLNFTLKTWIVIEAGQELADDQKSGALELLLSVPLTVQDILRGQLLALRRQFLKPVLVSFGIVVVCIWVLYLRTNAPRVLVIGSAAILMFALDVAALIGVAIWRALTSRNHNAATISTMARVLFLPWIAFGLVVASARLWEALTFSNRTPTWQFYLWVWFGLGLAADLVFGGCAWWLLLNRFRQLALRRFNPTPTKLGRKYLLGASPASAEGAVSPREKAKASPKLNRWNYRIALSSLGLVLIASVWISLRRKPALPPPVVVAVSGRPGATQVFTGPRGVFIILPDGSLWRWGLTYGSESSRAEVPRRVGSESDWIQAVSDGIRCAGVRANGTICEWGSSDINSATELPQAAPFVSGWKRVALLPNGVTAALRQDGTLWDLRQVVSGNGLPKEMAQQVGTNQNWVDLTSSWTGALALANDGALWKLSSFSPPGFMAPASIPPAARSGTPQPQAFLVHPGQSLNPTRIFETETNWMALVSGTLPHAWTRSGELWALGLAHVSPIPAAASPQLVLSNSAPGRAAIAYNECFALRSDGTLWTIAYADARGNPPGSAGWRRLGERSDWLMLWGGYGTVLGLTADGTLWIWGTDFSQKPVVTLGMRLKTFRYNLKLLVTGQRVSKQAGFSLPYRSVPRPILRMVPPAALQRPSRQIDESE